MNVTVTNSTKTTAAEKLQNKISSVIQKNISNSDMRRFMAMENLEDKNQSAVILALLNKEYGFTGEQLKDFYLKLCAISETAAEYTIKLSAVPEIAELLKMDIDIEELNKQHLIGNNA